MFKSRRFLAFFFSFIFALSASAALASPESDFRGSFELSSDVISDLADAGAKERARLSGATPLSTATAEEEQHLVLNVPYKSGEIQIELIPNLDQILGENHPLRDANSKESQQDDLETFATFKGRVLSGNPKDYASVSTYHSNGRQIVEGLFVLDGQMYFIEPFTTYFGLSTAEAGASTSDSLSLVVSNLPAETLESIHTSCGTSANHYIGDGHEHNNGTTIASVLPDSLRASAAGFTTEEGGTRIIEVDAVGDWEWRQKNNSNTTQARNKIMSILAGVDTIYRDQLGFGVAAAGTPEIKTSSNDGLSGTEAVAMLEQFRDANLQSGGDHVTLFTGRQVDGGTIGIAWVGAVCVSGFKYSVNQFYPFNTGALNGMLPLVAHELGHNVGSGHVSGSGIMNPFINIGADTFSSSATSQITTNLAKTQSNCVAEGAASTYTVSGRVVLTGTSTGLSGVSISLSPGNGSATTNASGNYSISNVSNGSYTASASKSGYSITPTSRSVTVSNGNASVPNFSATQNQSTYTISGRVVLSGTAAGLQGVTVNLSGGGSTTTNSSGNYSFSNKNNGSYTVSATRSGYTITPSQRSVTVSNSDKTVPNFTATQDQSAPTITTNPTDATRFAGWSVEFTCAASGTGLNYQWQRSTGGNTYSNISGQTSTTLSASSVNTSHDGYKYRCRVSNGGGTRDSSAATLRVKPLPTVSASPSNITPGTSVTLTLSQFISGLSYTWKDGNSIISNTAQASIAKRFNADASIRVIINDTSSGDTLTTSATNISVTINAPVITLHPQSTTADAGSKVVLTADASGFGALTYTWYKNGTSMPGPKGKKAHILNKVDYRDNGDTYMVMVSDDHGHQTPTQTATVSVRNNGEAPVILKQPFLKPKKALKIRDGSTVKFKVVAKQSASNPSKKVDIEWHHDNTPIPGANKPSYSFKFSAATAGKYRAVVTNKQGNTTPSDEIMVVAAPPIAARLVGKTNGRSTAKKMVVKFKVSANQRGIIKGSNSIIQGYDFYINGTLQTDSATTAITGKKMKIKKPLLETLEGAVITGTVRTSLGDFPSNSLTVDFRDIP